MKRILLALVAVGSLGAIALLCTVRTDNAAENAKATAAFDVEVDAKKNPWTGLKANNDPEQFQFAVVSDRTGGHRRGVFSRAVQQVNLMQPEFVMSVGDLIEGSFSADTMTKQWDEFDGYAKQFAMPFFYCPGNHDMDSPTKTKVWMERNGRAYYHFRYQGCLFVVMNSMDSEAEDPKDPAIARKGLRVGPRQNAYFQAALKAGDKPRWTFVFIHHPIWTGLDLDANGWKAVEKTLDGSQYTVFCGHVHNYKKFVRNGMNYYQLATTGGGSAMRGVEYGEFDQMAWMTMKKKEPVMVNLLLNGVVKDDLRPFESTEPGAEIARESLPGVVGAVKLGLKPVESAKVTFWSVVDGEEPKAMGDGRTTLDGTFALYSNRIFKGLKAGDYTVTVEPAALLVVDPNAKPLESALPEIYAKPATSPLRAVVKDGVPGRFEFKLEEPKKD